MIKVSLCFSFFEQQIRHQQSAPIFSSWFYHNVHVSGFQSCRLWTPICLWVSGLLSEFGCLSFKLKINQKDVQILHQPWSSVYTHMPNCFQHSLFHFIWPQITLQSASYWSGHSTSFDRLSTISLCHSESINWWTHFSQIDIFQG